MITKINCFSVFYKVIQYKKWAKEKAVRVVHSAPQWWLCADAHNQKNQPKILIPHQNWSLERNFRRSRSGIQKQQHIQICDRNSTYLYLHHKLNQTVYRWVCPSEPRVSPTSEVQGGPWKSDKDVHSEKKLTQNLNTKIWNLQRQMGTDPTYSN